MSLLVAEIPYRQQISHADGGAVQLRTADFATSATWTAFRTSNGDQVGSGSAVRETVSVGGVDVGTYLTATLPAGLPIEQGYRLRFALNTGAVRDDIRFDVVREPYPPLVRLPDIRSLASGLDDVVEHLAAREGVTADQQMEAFAAVARGKLDRMVRDRLVRTEDRTVVMAEQILGRARSEIFLRGYMVLDTDWLRDVERHLAVAAVFRANRDGTGFEDEDQRQAEDFANEAKAILEDSGRLSIDIDHDGSADVVAELGGTVTLRRVPA